MRGLMRRALSLAAACAMTTTLTMALFTAPAMALEQIKMSIFQSNFCCFAVYVAKHLKLFEKHGVDVELVYGTGIQPANIFVSGSAESGAFAVEHGVTVSSKGQDLKLIVLRAATAAAQPDRAQRRADAECRQALSAEPHRPERAEDRHQRPRRLDRHGDAIHAQAGRPRSGQGRHHHAGRRSRHHAGLAQEQGDRRRHGGRADPDRRRAVAQVRQDHGRYRRRRRPERVSSLRL